MVRSLEAEESTAVVVMDLLVSWARGRGSKARSYVWKKGALFLWEAAFGCLVS